MKLFKLDCYSGGSGIEVTPPPTDILFGSSAVTNTDGTRSIVSEGTDTTPKIDLYSGQGLRFDSTQYFDTGFVVDFSKDFTLLWMQELLSLGGGRSGFDNSLQDRFMFGFNSVGIRVVVGDGAKTVAVTTVGKVYSMFVTYNATTKQCTFGEIGGDSTNFIATNAQASSSIHIGGVNNSTLAQTGKMSNVCFIPYILSNAELISHGNNPERTLYKNNGILSSDFLSQQVLDDIESGLGFWYPLCENNNLKRGTDWGAVSNAVVKPELTIVEATTEWDYLGDGIYETLSIAREDIDLNADIGYDYLIDIEVIESNNVDLRFWSGTSTYQLISTNLGKQRFYFNCRAEKCYIYSIDNGFIGKIKLSNLIKLTPIVNFANSNIRNNATRMPYGLQSALLKRDVFGIPVGLSDGQLIFSGDGYALPETPVTVTGNWCIDFYVAGEAGNTLVVFSTDTADNIEVSFNASGELVVDMLTVQYTEGISRAVVSFERDGTTLKAFVNNIEVLRTTYTGQVTLNTIASSFVAGEFGSLTITKTVRTYGQRLSIYNELKAKYGV